MSDTARVSGTAGQDEFVAPGSSLLVGMNVVSVKDPPPHCEPDPVMDEDGGLLALKDPPF